MVDSMRKTLLKTRYGVEGGDKATCIECASNIGLMRYCEKGGVKATNIIHLDEGCLVYISIMASITANNLS